MISQEIQRLIIKYLTRQATLLERNKLEVWLESYDNSKIFKEYVKINYLIDLNMEMFDADDSKKELLELIDNEKKQYRFRKYTRVMKYAAVFVGIIVTTYFFKDNIFNKSIETNPIIVDTNTIEPGTDKATLTLGDGSQIALEKGKSLKTQNANSNGEEIIYKANQSNTKEIAYNYLTIPRGGQFFIKLSDGTQVWLNSETQLKFPVNFIEGETRQVELVYGEAYFDVSSSTLHKGSKFKVLNQSQEVEVLGTEFNIKAYKEETNVYTTLVEGRVSVSALNKIKILEPNEQLNLNQANNTMVSSTVDIYRVVSWKEGVFSFKNKPLKDIMKVLSRWYDVKAVFSNESLETITFNGSLDKKLSIEEILDIIIGSTNSTSISYEINNKTILLK